MGRVRHENREDALRLLQIPIPYVTIAKLEGCRALQLFQRMGQDAEALESSVLKLDPQKNLERAIAQKMMVHENIVRNRLESRVPLSAQEIIDGVRLDHQEFLFLVRAAMPELNRISRE